MISIVPAYSYYRYAALEDRICIVDPETYEIVDMIDEGAYAAGPLPIGELRLTSSERALVLDSIARTTSHRLLYAYASLWEPKFQDQ